MKDASQIIRGGTLVDPVYGLFNADLLIKDGKIQAQLRPGTLVSEDTIEINAQGLHVFPGLIDAHLHFGFGEKISEYSTETRTAAIGGVSTVLGYFLNNESYQAVFDREIAYASERAHIDYGFHFSVANEEHLTELPNYVDQLGVSSFKYFMNFRGEEGRYLGLDGTDDGYLYDLLQQAGKIEQAVVVCHTENIEIVNRLRHRFINEQRNTLKDWNLSKPAFTEAENCLRAMYFAEHAGAKLYIPHVSSRLALIEIKYWRQRYNAVYIETCPHYLTHTLEADDGSVGKANPPFRHQDDVDALWEGLADGTIDVVGSDHVPRKVATKQRPIWLASQGFPGVATMLSVLLHEGFHKDRLSLQRIAQLMSANPAQIFGLSPRKGSLQVGADADITLVDIHLRQTVQADKLESYSDYSLYDNRQFTGWPVRTIVRGHTVMQDGVITGLPGHGLYIKR